MTRMEMIIKTNVLCFTKEGEEVNFCNMVFIYATRNALADNSRSLFVDIFKCTPVGVWPRGRIGSNLNANGHAGLWWSFRVNRKEVARF